MDQLNELETALFKMTPLQDAFLKPSGGGAILMPTPKALDGVKGNLKTSDERLESGHQVDLPNVVLDLVDSNQEIALFGTVTTATSGRSPKFRGNGTSVVEFAEEVADKLNTSGGGACCQLPQPATGKAQTTAVQEAHQVAVSPPLLPTTRRSMGNASQPEVAAGDPKKRIENTVLLNEITWGKFEPAIRRWENVLGRPAPAPTKPDGRDDAHRLSSEFTEWMMGLPAGWVTGCGLTRNEELKACGNGVVPQQAELALRILLEGISFESDGGGQ